jgi:hypothetical protein
MDVLSGMSWTSEDSSRNAVPQAVPILTMIGRRGYRPGSGMIRSRLSLANRSRNEPSVGW